MYMPRRKYTEIPKEEIKATLARIPLSRTEIANKLGITTNTVRRWVNEGRVPVDMWNLIKGMAFESAQGVDFAKVAIFNYPAGNDKKQLLKDYKLEDLVAEIESRNWEVSLSLKNNKKE